MKEMQVGDIGVLQHMINSPQLNGVIAEVIGGLKLRAGYNPDKIIETSMKYKCKHPISNWNGDYIGNVKPHQIRPLSDPDATQSIDEQETIEA